MKVSQVMHSNPVCVTTKESIANIAKEMKKGDFGAVLVKEGDQPLGVVTDRDIVLRALTKGHNTADIKAKDIMTKKVITCDANESIEHAADKMKQEQVRRLIVLDEQNKVIGIISLGDIAVCQKGKESGPTFEALQKISEHH